MLTFGAIQFASGNDGGLTIIVDNTKHFLTADDSSELVSWLSYYHNNRPRRLEATRPIYQGAMGAAIGNQANLYPADVAQAQGVEANF